MRLPLTNLHNPVPYAKKDTLTKMKGMLKKGLGGWVLENKQTE